MKVKSNAKAGNFGVQPLIALSAIVLRTNPRRPGLQTNPAFSLNCLVQIPIGASIHA
jgi:hypothetical protein